MDIFHISVPISVLDIIKSQMAYSSLIHHFSCVEIVVTDNSSLAFVAQIHDRVRFEEQAFIRIASHEGY